jgi:VanZ family protein
LRAWLWVLLWSLTIFTTIPFARDVQKFVYATFGREFFTYAVLFIIGIVILLLLYIFVFSLRIKSKEQYFWLLLCGFLYSYFTLILKKHPEEAVHFLEYGLLSYLLFNALSKRIHDKTIYITSVLCVFFIGTLDEFIQWMIPERFWGFRDIGINTLAGAILMLGVWKGIRPEKINKPLNKLSINLLISVITIDLLIIGLCLSNTPEGVRVYTEKIPALSWLRFEEPMIEYGYKHNDPEIGIIYSRFSLDELREIDSTKGMEYGKELSQLFNTNTYGKLMRIYNPVNNPFVYEFLVHLARRDEAMRGSEVDGIRALFKENMILERYFTNTLMYAGRYLSERSLERTDDTDNNTYISNVNGLITPFNPILAWITIFIIILLLWLLRTLIKI